MSVKRIYQRAESVVVADGRLCLLRQGNGPPVLLLHGIPLSLVTWRHNIADLAKHFTVVALDLKGFGRSEKSEGDYSPEGHIRAIRQVLDSLGISNIYIVASSYACALAVHLAVTHPELVGKIVLINSVGCASSQHSLERLVRIGLVSTFIKLLLRSEAAGRILFASRLRKSYGSPKSYSNKLCTEYFNLLRHDHGEETFLSTLRQFDEHNLLPLFPTIQQDTLILWGNRDQILPIDNGYKIRSLIQHSRLEVLSGCGHLPHEEAPDKVNNLIINFLRGPAI